MKLEVYSYECWFDVILGVDVITQTFHLQWKDGTPVMKDKWVRMEGPCVGVLFEKRIPWWKFW